MANIKISDLTAYTDPAVTDVLPIVDLVNDETKKVEVEDLLKSFGAGTAALPSFAFGGNGDPNTGIYSPGADQVAISTNGTQRATIDSSGNVLVGKTVSSGLNAGCEFRAAGLGLFTRDSANPLQVRRLTDDGDLVEFYKDSILRGSIGVSGTSLTIGVAGNEKLRIDSSGRLLVGTSSTSATCTAVFSNRSDGATDPVVRLEINSTSPPNGAALGGFNFASSGLSGFQAGARIAAARDGGTWTNGSSHPTYLEFATTADGASSPTERMRIDSSGRLGLGTSSPSTNFELRGSGASIAGLNVHALISDSTTAASGVGGSILFEGNYTSGGARAAFGAIAGTKENGTDSNYAGNLKFYTRNNGSLPALAMTINSSQRVGIGTTTPSQLLHLSSTGFPTIRVTDADNSTYFDITNSDGDIILKADEGNAFANSAIRFNVDSSERMRLDSSGRLLVGTSSAPGSTIASTAFLQVQGRAGFPADYALANLRSGYTPSGADAALGFLTFSDSSNNIGAWITGYSDAAWTSGSSHPSRLMFATTASGSSSPTERMRITQSGVIIANTDVNSGFIAGNSYYFTVGDATATGHYMRGGNEPALHVRSSAAALFVGRQSDDGELVGFYQNGSKEGSISVSGTTVSYNGAHLSRWSQLPGGAERTEILRGTVLSNIDEMCGWGEEDNEQLNRMKVSNVEGDPNVAGVFQAWDDDDDTYTDDFYCAMTGDFVIRIAQGTTVARGDLLMSAGDGTAKPQDDDIVRSKTIAKVTSTTVSTTYADGSYCVPCVLMAC